MRTMHNNERATQIRLLRQLFYSPLGFPHWRLAKNLIYPIREHGAASANVSRPSNQSIKLSKMWDEPIKMWKTCKPFSCLASCTKTLWHVRPYRLVLNPGTRAARHAWNRSRCPKL
jgi:hypothetical protein